MYGWRARIGVMIPSTNTVVESEYNRMCPEGVSIHASRMFLQITNAATLIGMAEQVERSAKELGTARCNAIVYGCTSGSFVGGVEWEANIARKIADASNTTAITTSGAIVRALSNYDVKKISIATPYIPELNELEKIFLESHGYCVVSITGLGLDDNISIGCQTPEKTYSLARSVVKPETELLLITCTDFRSIELIKKLEQDLHIPVLSSNLCGFWAALRACGIGDQLTEYGSLFQY